jgi:hypothetical protein
MWWLCGTWGGGGGAACTVMDAVPDFDESCVLVALIVIAAAADGAV